MLDPEDDFKEYTLELLKKLDYEFEDNMYVFKNKFSFSYVWDSLNKKAKKEILNRLISQIEITRDENYNIEIKNVKFTDEFISKNPKEYLEYLQEILVDNNIGITYKEQINKKELENLSKKYTIVSLEKIEHQEYSEQELNEYMEIIQEHFYEDGIINCPYIEDNNVVDTLLLIPKTKILN